MSTIYNLSTVQILECSICKRFHQNINSAIGMLEAELKLFPYSYADNNRLSANPTTWSNTINTLILNCAY